MRSIALLITALFALVACTATPIEAPLGADGKPLPRLYRISKSNESRIQIRMLDSVNALRQASGAPALQLNASLNAAAATHSRDMSVQNRPWHFGSDGSSPVERVQRAGYELTLLGENISETFETELQTLAAWMAQPDTRQVILDREGRDMGFSWFQEPGGKIWWTLIIGGGGPAQIPQAAPSASLEPDIPGVIPPATEQEGNV
ncbi:putative transmembrane protein [Candidatus Rhodobacter oscarellae]|uniref:Putative transmembrane protein n=1 Tax=Candidatus Rhodobacter oscarellae TaxID=1675527 RepID=A0A0J9GZH0_9RHOB|nr:CAP domain-containing protein [Candidatus Rhodobacter lobularis]KMW58873.1 putative transmembrane protein [Candidatus Rhodobacter lobularis]